MPVLRTEIEELIQAIVEVALLQLLRRRHGVAFARKQVGSVLGKLCWYVGIWYGTTTNSAKEKEVHGQLCVLYASVLVFLLILESNAVVNMYMCT